MKKAPKLVLPVFLGIVIAWLLSLALAGVVTLSQLRQGNLHQTAQSARVTQVLFSPFSLVLGPLIPDVRLTNESLTLVQQLDQVSSQLKTYLPATLAADPASSAQATQLRQEISSLTKNMKTWSSSYTKSWLLPHIIKQQVHQEELTFFLENPNQISEFADLTQTLSDHFLQGVHRYVIVLQNSDELRATGGFMGSYVLFEIKDGVINSLDVQDIYVPDGQFTGYLQPPAGVAEFLSSGKGWHLPDSNWNPDFPSAAEDITRFFGLGKVNDLEGVVAINLPFVEKLLGLTGPLYLPDFNQTVTSENLSSLARADRQTFFPGSQQKQQFLHALFAQLKLNVTELKPETLRQMQKQVIAAVEHKDIQLYSRDPDVQKLSLAHQLTGKILTQGSSRYFFSVESNVGINKANRLVTRQVALSLQEYSSSIQVQFTNQNPPTTLKSERGEYINYQRLFVPSNYLVHNLEINGHQVTHWDEQLFTTSTGEKLKQIGFLVTVPAQSKAAVVIEFAHPLLPLKALTLQKQAGLSATPYHITTPTGTTDLILEKDQAIQLP